jgi:hypothetical protein
MILILFTNEEKNIEVVMEIRERPLNDSSQYEIDFIINFIIG